MLKKAALGAALLLASAGFAAASCPSVSEPAASNIATTGEDLWTPNSYRVTAGGNLDLAACPSVPGTGYIISNPDFEMSLSGMGNYSRLQLRVEAACDTVLLVNDSRGAWHFSDDANGTYNPLIDITGATDGVYDIWIGTYNTALCEASLVLETF